MPASLAVVLSTAVGLTVAAPASASASGELTVSATVSATDDGAIYVTGSGTGAQGDDVYVSINHANTPCAATEAGEGGGIYEGSASGSFSFTASHPYGNTAPGAYFACVYVGTYQTASQTAQSGTVSILPCAPDTSFTVGKITVGTTKYEDADGHSEFGDYHGFLSFSVQTGFPGYATNGGAAQLQQAIVVGGGGSNIATWKTVAAQSGKYEFENQALKKTGGTNTFSILVYPYNDYGQCYTSDGNVVQVGSSDGYYHAPAQTLKVSFGAACKGGTVTLDGQSVSVTNDSRSVPTTKTLQGTEDCSGYITPAKSGKCTRSTKLAKGYACVHHKVVKKRRRHTR